ncbi:adenylosuccinate synthetase [Vibrio campbellii]|uniref:adenylosuccinate synthetase n=1 Tax=Vibrio campbellii TaxID=680 RepID=UPI0003AB2C5B|nr:adenylosuccinate synthetase [Vibrio campbellii]
MFKSVVGLQFGDEGKGKFVDMISDSYQHIARFNGGANAGHTVEVNGQRFAFSQIPATVHNNKKLYVCQGALVSMEKMLDEINLIEKICPDSNIFIDPRCHIVMPLHSELNKSSESYRGAKKIGSVGIGVGASFEDKSNRLGIRLIDTIDPITLREKLEIVWDIRSKQIELVFGGRLTLDFEEQIQNLITLGKRLEPYFCFTNKMISDLISSGHDVFLESSQATFLDNSFGSYPYTVAYQTLIQSCFPMIGVPAQNMSVLGIMKAYTIRVGNGALPTELHDKDANIIRLKGNEFGTVSNRPRRIGWLDLALISHAVQMNGVSEIAITNVDVLGGESKIKVCTGYTLGKKKVSVDEALLHFDKVTPIYHELDPWPHLGERTQFSSIKEMPNELLQYLSFIENYVGVTIRYISYGPDRSQTLKRRNSEEFYNDMNEEEVF